MNEKIEIDKIKKTSITNLFLISDIHIGLGKGSDEWLDMHREYFEKFFIPLLQSKKNEGSAVLCLGDVFEDRKTTNLAANHLAIEIFEKMAEILPVYVIVGNHDMYNGTNNRITSLRSFDNIPNLTMVKKPTLWEATNKVKMLLIPYQGDVERESNIVSQNNKANYVFLHSDVKSLHYDNGMEITSGVDVSSVKGKVYAGHIHKREEQNNLVYVGNPFQTKWSDFANQKGIYHLNLADGTREFYPNNISPSLIRIGLEQINGFADAELEPIIRHNTVQIIIKKSETQKLQAQDLFDRLQPFKPWKLIYKEVADEALDGIEDLSDSDEYKEMSLQELGEALIDEMNLDPKFDKTKLKAMNAEYINLVINELA